MSLLQMPSIQGEEILHVVPIVGLVLGLAFCFFGYRIFRALLVLVGFVTGGVLGVAAANAGFEGQPALQLVGFIMGGVIGGALFFLLYYVGVFLYGVGIAVLLVFVGFAAAGLPPHPIILFVVGLLGGILALVFHRVVIILLTAGSGAWYAVVSGFYLAEWSNTFQDMVRRTSESTGEKANTLGRLARDVTPLMLGTWLALTVLGAIVQFSVTGRKKVVQEGLPPPAAPPPLRS